MNTFKKITAVAMAAVTLAATMLTAGAYNADITLGELTPTADYKKAPTIHYSQLSDFFDNYVQYSKVKSGVGNGCYVLSVDVKNGSKNISNDDIAYHLENLYLQNTSGKYITQGKCPLVIDTWTLGKNGRANIIASSPDIFKGNLLDITNARFFSGKKYNGREERDVLKLSYTIKGAAVLPSYNISVGGVECETDFSINYINDLGTGKLNTECEVTVFVPHSFIATTQPISIDGVKIADIKLTYRTTCPEYKNY